ncbi:MAG: Aminodeoxyfutalosine synthase (EC 2.5.1.120) [Olavius algarvensis Delta 4 endosymbiont]|nr:MAG: Aminodeoxyfutalosine synthase (EC 2.5.1.120) [Olavius algarvensis Delta 4 endosymbiont]
MEALLSAVVFGWENHMRNHTKETTPAAENGRLPANYPRVADATLQVVREKVLAGERLNQADGLSLFKTPDLVGLGQLADYVRKKRHQDKAYYIYNQHLNYTNVCRNRCRFCAFARDEHQDGSFALSLEQIEANLLERIDEPIKELHIVGGLNPDLDFAYFIELLRLVKKIRPAATIKAFTPVEIDYLHRITGYSIQEVIAQLKAAGLAMMPGGGAEVMSDRIQAALFPEKIGAARWLEIMEAVHQAGISSNATVLYGHIETAAEKVDHLLQIRELQDRTGGFSAFIPLAFHSQNTQLADLPATTAFDDLKTIAAARLLLDNFDHIKAYWVMIGESLAQVALSFGADDLDGTIIEEKITHMAGARSAKGLSRPAMRSLIRAAGFRPVERDSFYNPITANC